MRRLATVLVLAFVLSGCTGDGEPLTPKSSEDYDYVEYEKAGDEAAEEQEEPVELHNSTKTYELRVTQARTAGMTTNAFLLSNNCLAFDHQDQIVNGTVTAEWTAAGAFDQNLRLYFRHDGGLQGEVQGVSPLRLPFNVTGPGSGYGYDYFVIDGVDDGAFHDLGVRLTVEMLHKGPRPPPGLVYSCTLFG